jgi:hypothetical protein
MSLLRESFSSTRDQKGEPLLSTNWQVDKRGFKELARIYSIDGKQESVAGGGFSSCGLKCRPRE